MTYTPPPNDPNSVIEDVSRAFRSFTHALQGGANAVGDAFVTLVYPAIEQTTELIGHTIAPIADIPFIRFATGVPGLSWVLAALGQVNAEKVAKSVGELRSQHPLATDEELAQRVIASTTLRAAQVGLLTNIIPPVAALMFAIDIGAIAALQAEMIYKIAAIYGFSTEDAARRGEVLAIWGVFTGSSSTLKSGLSFFEVIPGAGTAIGISSDAAIIYGVGFLASRYYAVKLQRGISG